ncbi:upstream activation factor subunit spp27-like isoform X1 [Phoenix dactylifera]|uniref:Upstream activation factor subunit spp27-like isoform X1 n=1 Tax=Phoenix dactylifera TaxID=42345 RepID=A0A8B8J605_PHODC|nr:upstream activation factor subunit spp27-like isoform X2 [Phoenix dactylifera]XP_026661270.1 upstream activation factor subunit spp27-like isoform X1 [Phoenix dactylifera]XP_026661271.1 upstream activation factor subunit spp27-like isoform X3 [Phoenix dactylifera]XP_038971671.1 upstream activation factor subunit spp27-like isoform X1 [Phoenix dactylifera]
MVSDSELVERLREFLRASDLSTTTTAIVRRKLEEDFGVDLSSKKAFIREQVDLFLHSELNDNKEVEEDDGLGREEGERDREEGRGEADEEEDDEQEDDEEEEDEGGSSRKRRLTKLNKEVKKRGGGFTKLCSLSPALQQFVGESELARTEVVKKLWAYIRQNNLQDPNNKKKIICDERLQSIFNVSTIDMFQMNKALSKHIWPLNSEGGPSTVVKSEPKEKQHKKEREGKRQKGGSSGLLAPLPLSDDLVKFIGTGENALSRSDVVKRMWEYIKQNNLQDPADKRNIICDKKLKELLKVDSFRGFTVSKLLVAHFIKTK